MFGGHLCQEHGTRFGGPSSNKVVVCVVNINNVISGERRMEVANGNVRDVRMVKLVPVKVRIFSLSKQTNPQPLSHKQWDFQ